MVKILVVGEDCTDKFIYCETNRLSPEAPVPVLYPLEVKTNQGMAGNVVENLRSLSFAVDVIKWSQKEQITKTRYVDKKSNHMFLRVDEGEENVIPLHLENIMKEQIGRYDIVIVSDYDKGFLNLETIEEIGKLSKLSILDSKKRLTPKVFEAFSFLKLNEFEARNNNLVDGSEKLLITLGNRGCQHMTKLYPSPNPQETIDVSGAGDTFTASFILKYFETKNIETSITFANEMSAKVVNKRGVATP